MWFERCASKSKVFGSVFLSYQLIGPLGLPFFVYQETSWDTLFESVLVECIGGDNKITWCFFCPELRIHPGGCALPKVQGSEITQSSIFLSCEIESELERV